jgi:hypothetical protein
MKALFLLSLLPIASFAADKHVHGEANLFIVLDKGPKVLAEFESPAANIIGFEHTPKTPEERKSVADATAQLQKYDSLLEFPNGECQLVSSSVTQPFGESHDEHEEELKHHGKHEDEHEHHDEHEHESEHAHHDEHEHENEHEHEHHDEHKHESEHAHHDEHEHHDDHGKTEGHSEFQATYHLSCKHPEKITHATIRAFSQFAGIEKLTVEWITPNKQGSSVNTKQDTRVKF